MIRAVVDAARLACWPPDGYRILLPHLQARTWPIVRGVAWAHRRLLLGRTRVIAVVGSVGKTTTKRALDAALGARVARHSKSNHGAGLAMNLLRTRPRHAATVLEVGIDRPGQMARFARLVAPDVVVVTAIASDHRRSFHALEATREEKAHMVRALSPDDPCAVPSASAC